MKCNFLKNNSVNLDDYTFKNIYSENYESPKFSSNKQSKSNLNLKYENNNQNNKQIIIMRLI